MKISGVHFTLASFLTGFVLSFAIHAAGNFSPSRNARQTSQVAATLPPDPSPGKRKLPSPPLPILGEPGSTPMQAEASRHIESDRILLKRCQDLCQSDPEAAFRAGMARWAFGPKALTEAAVALVKKDPEAARRLLLECPNLRSKNVLLSAIMTDEVTRDPAGKLEWAQENLHGSVKRQAVRAGFDALASLDPDLALDLLLEWGHSDLTMNGASIAIGKKLQQNPTAALAWIIENVTPAKQDLFKSYACDRYFRANPEAKLSAFAALPEGFHGIVGTFIVDSALRDQATSFAHVVGLIHAFPEANQDAGIRQVAESFLWLQNPDIPYESGRSPTEFLASLTSLENRAAAVESFTTAHLKRFPHTAWSSKASEWFGQLQTPEDRATATRVVQANESLTEIQRADILNRLK